MTRTMTQPEMAAWDAGTFELIQRQAGLDNRLSALITEIHRAAGDTRSYTGWGASRVVTWQLTHEEAAGRLSAVPCAGGNALLAQLSQAREAIAQLGAQVEEREALWEAKGRWPRYFPCLNADGHIHSSLRGCPTVRHDTSMGWATELSGRTVTEAVAALGETLCSVCFPGAPAQWCRTRSEVTRAERERAAAAKKAEKAAREAVKNLTRDESRLLSEATGERVTTVAAAKAIVREAAEAQVELEWNRTEEAGARWQDPERHAEFTARLEERLAEKQHAAALAVEILSAREITAPGSGWSRADAAKSVDGTVKRTRRAYFG